MARPERPHLGVVLQRFFHVAKHFLVVNNFAVCLLHALDFPGCHTVGTCNGLHQRVVLHGLVHVPGGQTGRVKAGQPHGAHKHQLQRVRLVLEVGLNVVHVRVQAAHTLTVWRNVQARATNFSSSPASSLITTAISNPRRQINIYSVNFDFGSMVVAQECRKILQSSLRLGRSGRPRARQWQPESKTGPGSVEVETCEEKRGLRWVSKAAWPGSSSPTCHA